MTNQEQDQDQGRKRQETVSAASNIAPKGKDGRE